MTATHPPCRLGYGRVSTYGQTLDAQIDQLLADGCTRLFRDYIVHELFLDAFAPVVARLAGE